MKKLTELAMEAERLTVLIPPLEKELANIRAKIQDIHQQMRVFFYYNCPSKELTPRETHIHALVLMGRCNKEIAKESGCSVSTVKFNVSNLLRKSGVKTRAELIAKGKPNHEAS